MGRTGSLALALLMSAALGCGGDRAPPETAGPPTKAAAPSADGPWRFVPTLEKHLPGGAIAEPILELSLPRKQTVIVLAAVLRTGSADPAVERWTFEPTPGEETLRLVEGGERLLRLQPGTRHAQLGDLRRSLATPRAVMTRPLGLEDDPRSTVERVATALAIMRDHAGDGRARVNAVATAIRGLDDAVVLERDAVWELAALLHPAPTAIEVKTLSERRARATLTLEGGTATLELQRKADGWAIASFEAPPPAPAQPNGPTDATVEL